MTEQNAQTPVENQDETPAVLNIQRVYVKDVSFEAPNLPHIFQNEWDPETKMELNTETTHLTDDLYEVCLNISTEVTLKESKEVAFICEVKQAGVFMISGLQDIQLTHALTSQCPTILFPYARELIASLVNRGTFPALNLAPINFDVLFMEMLQRQEQQAAEENKEVH